MKACNRMRRTFLTAGVVVGLGLGAFYFLVHPDAGTDTQSSPSSKASDSASQTFGARISQQASTTAGQEASEQVTGSDSEMIARDPFVRELCGPDAVPRLRALGQQGELSRQECERLYRFLRQRTTGERLDWIVWVKNDVMNLLAQQSHLPAPWDEMLEALYADEGQHWIIRDYALQHLFEFCDEATRTGQAQKWSAARQSRIEGLFWTALEETQESVAGTALLALWRLSDLGMSIDRERVASKSLELAAQSTVGQLARITSLQVSAGLGDRRILKLAPDLVEHGETSALRASAIAAVGRLGGADELAWLERQPVSANRSLRVATEAAIRQIRSRIKG